MAINIDYLKLLLNDTRTVVVFFSSLCCSGVVENIIALVVAVQLASTF